MISAQAQTSTAPIRTVFSLVELMAAGRLGAFTRRPVNHIQVCTTIRKHQHAHVHTHTHTHAHTHTHTHTHTPYNCYPKVLQSDEENSTTCSCADLGLQDVLASKNMSGKVQCVERSTWPQTDSDTDVDCIRIEKSH